MGTVQAWLEMVAGGIVAAPLDDTGNRRQILSAARRRPHCRAFLSHLVSHVAVHLWRLQSHRMAVVDFGHSLWRGLVRIGFVRARPVWPVLESHRLVRSHHASLRALSDVVY